MTYGLKPCPFCGSDRLHLFAMDDGVKCLDCGAKITGVIDWKERWNRRASETPGEISDGEGLRLIADGGEYKVFATPIGDKPYYLLKGHRGTDYLFSEAQWDQYARVIAYADIKIRGGIE